MTSHRLRFLASLSERLQNDLASREQDGDDSTPLARLELTGPPGDGDQASPDEFAGDEIAGPPARRAPRVEPEQDPESEALAPPGATASPDPSVPWSEIGMPLRLREAIASVRRVSHDMHGPPDDDYAMHGPAPLGDPAAYHDYPLDDDGAYEQPPPDDRLARLEHDAGPSGEQRESGGHRASEERPPDDDLVLLDDGAGFQHEQTPVDDAGYEEWQAEDELVLLDDDILHGDGQRRFAAHTGHAERPPEGAPIPLDDDPAYRYGQIPLDDDTTDEEVEPGDEAAHVPMRLDDDTAGQESAPGRQEAPQDRQPLRRGRTTRYGLHAAAFAVAIAFVALAGFGLGVLSDGREGGEPLTRDTVRAAPTEPAPLSTGQQALRTEPEQQGELSELVTVRVAPAPVAAVPESSPAAQVATSAPPLPPPPKPVLRQTATDEAASTDRQLAGAVDDAGGALLEAEGGAGGPFQPLFAKLPASPPAQTRVFVHYTASAVGAPAIAMHLVRHLKAEGFAVEARPVEFPIPTNSIRYFFHADRDQAEVLRSSLEGQIPDGAALSVMDFTSYEPRPRPGLIEIWLRA